MWLSLQLFVGIKFVDFLYMLLCVEFGWIDLFVNLVIFIFQWFFVYWFTLFLSLLFLLFFFFCGFGINFQGIKCVSPIRSNKTPSSQNCLFNFNSWDFVNNGAGNILAYVWIIRKSYAINLSLFYVLIWCFFVVCDGFSDASVLLFFSGSVLEIMLDCSICI